MIFLSIYGISFQFELTEDLASALLADFPAWVRSQPVSKPSFTVQVESRKGTYLFRAGGVPVRKSSDARVIRASLREFVHRALAARDRRHGYLFGGVARWRQRVCLVSGYARRGTTTFLQALARDGGQILADDVVAITAQGRVVPFPIRGRALQPDLYLFMNHLSQREFRIEPMTSGGSASMLLNRAVPNPKFFPAFAAIARDAPGYYVLRAEAQEACERLGALLVPGVAALSL